MIHALIMRATHRIAVMLGNSE